MTRLEIGSEELRQRFPMPVQGEDQLLEHLLTAGVQDPVYMAALEEAAALLRAL
jgi:hypothetical protein